MNNQQKKSTLFNFEAIGNNNLSLSKNIKNMNSIFENNIETERSSEKLYNELKNKKGVNKILTVKEKSNNNTKKPKTRLSLGVMLRKLLFLSVKLFC